MQGDLKKYLFMQWKLSLLPDKNIFCDNTMYNSIRCVWSKINDNLKLWISKWLFINAHPWSYHQLNKIFVKPFTLLMRFSYTPLLFLFLDPISEPKNLKFLHMFDLKSLELTPVRFLSNCISRIKLNKLLVKLNFLLSWVKNFVKLG